MRKRVLNSDLVCSAIKAEIQGSGVNLGCRSMAKRLLTRHGISVGSCKGKLRFYYRDAVLEYQHLLDPEGVQSRSRHCLVRREYMNKGPNFLIHIDGYDKIKRYGFAIHGAICGFSRRILWLKVARTNNDPQVIAGYFLEYVTEIKGVPRCIRMDAGTENVKVIDMQKALRWHHSDRCAGDRSVIVGSSHTNQRIEAWWRQLRRMCVNFWMENFAKMEDEQVFSTAETLDIELLRFCFMKVLQNELDIVRKDWNEHRVRQQGHIATGKPEILFKHPELYGAIDYKHPVNEADIKAFEGFCIYPTSTGCSAEMNEIFSNIMTENQFRYPDTASEAMELFTNLKRVQLS